MENLVKFENKDFGEIRTLTIANEPWFVGKDVAMALGYAKPENAIATHVDDEDKTTTLIQGTGSNYKSKAVIINESGLYSLILSSKLPTAKKFKRWVTSEVLPAIRKTGEYKTQTATTQQDESKQDRAKSMLLNARTRQAKLWKELAEGATGTYAEVCKTYAVNTLAGKDVLELPALAEKTYSATEVGNILGISANKVGKIANKYNLKIDKYGKWFHDKSQYSSKEIETFRYNADGINIIRSMSQLKITESDGKTTCSTTVDLSDKNGNCFCAPLTITIPKKC